MATFNAPPLFDITVEREGAVRPLIAKVSVERVITAFGAAERSTRHDLLSDGRIHVQAESDRERLQVTAEAEHASRSRVCLLE